MPQPGMSVFCPGCRNSCQGLLLSAVPELLLLCTAWLSGPTRRKRMVKRFRTVVRSGRTVFGEGSTRREELVQDETFSVLEYAWVEVVVCLQALVICVVRS